MDEMTPLGIALTPLFAFFFRLVGKEAKAEIRRKKAAAAKVARAQAKKAAELKRLERAQLAEVKKNFLEQSQRREKRAAVAKRIARMRVELDPNPYIVLPDDLNESLEEEWKS